MKVSSAIIKYYILLTFIFISVSSYCQYSATPFKERKFPYINYDSSRLENFTENKNLRIFFDKLTDLCFTGSSHLSVLHIGGSHIQAGVWSLEMRRQFENLCPGMHGSSGLVFPFSIAKTNHPYYYSSSTKGKWTISKITDKEPIRDIGLAGMMCFTSDDEAEIEFKFNKRSDISDHKFDKISIFHNINDTCYELKILPEHNIDSSFINTETSATEYYFTNPVDSLKIIIKKKDSCKSEFHFYGAYLENSSPGINYTGVGINGASTNSFLKPWLAPQHLKAVKPDMVILYIGVNDAADKGFTPESYLWNYQIIISQILDINPDCAIILTTNNDFYNYSGKLNTNQDDISNSLKKLATTNNASVWDLYKIMGGPGSINMWRTDDLAKKDRIHFTDEGYKIVANLLFEAIVKEYETYLLRLSQTRN